MRQPTESTSSTTPSTSQSCCQPGTPNASAAWCSPCPFSRWRTSEGSRPVTFCAVGRGDLNRWPPPRWSRSLSRSSDPCATDPGFMMATYLELAAAVDKIAQSGQLSKSGGCSSSTPLCPAVAQSAPNASPPSQRVSERRTLRRRWSLPPPRVSTTSMYCIGTLIPMGSSTASRSWVISFRTTL